MDETLEHYLSRLSLPVNKAALARLYEAAAAAKSTSTNDKDGITFLSISVPYFGTRAKRWKDAFLLERARIDTTTALSQSDTRDARDLVEDIEEIDKHVHAARKGAFPVLLLLTKKDSSPASQVFVVVPAQPPT